LNEEDITHLNRSITSNEIEVEIKNFSIKWSPGRTDCQILPNL
jgi:hypothetical protein